MSKIFVRGIGAVSPAGWGVASLREAVRQERQIPPQRVASPDPGRVLQGFRVPVAAAKPAFCSQPRLRRSSPIGQYAVAAALEALATVQPQVPSNSQRLGIVYCSMTGCVNFSRRFYDETLKDPTTASPLVFPETVFNAPASHLGALLGSRAPNYTLVGDPGTFLQGLGLAADWLISGQVDGCLVVGAEELDHLVAQAFELFEPEALVSEGSGALYLETQGAPGAVELEAITNAHLFFNRSERTAAAAAARTEAGPDGQDSLLCDGAQGTPRLDRDEAAAWKDWRGSRLSPKRTCGEGFMAAAAWQCVAAVDALMEGLHRTAVVSVVGCNQQAIAARFGTS